MDYQWQQGNEQAAVAVIATGCSGKVTINIQYVFEQREHDTLRKLAETISARLEGRVACPIRR